MDIQDIKLPPIRKLNTYQIEWSKGSPFFSQEKIEPQKPNTWEQWSWPEGDWKWPE